MIKNVSDHEHIFNNVFRFSRLISISLTHIYALLIYTKGPKILVLSRILEISGPALYVPFAFDQSTSGLVLKTRNKLRTNSGGSMFVVLNESWMVTEDRLN